MKVYLLRERRGRAYLAMSSQLTLLSAGRFEALQAPVQKEIYKEFYDLVYGIVYYMISDHASTEDIIQESFLKIILHAPPTDNDAKLKSWIKTVVRNTVYSYLRKNKKRRHEADMECAGIKSECELVRQAESVEQVIEFKLMSEAVERALQELKPEYQALIELRWKRELSYREMADILNTSEETVKHKLHRARGAMRRRFVKLWGEPKEAVLHR